MKMFSFSVVTSTNDIAKKLLETRSNVIVTAKLQIKGRGRNNKQWVGDDSKNIFLSIGKEHITEEQDTSHVMIGYQCVGCLAVVQALEKIAPKVKFVLKYPNDVYAQDKDGEFRKIAGILIENEFIANSIKSTVIGIGVNVSQQYFDEEIKATSLIILDVTIKTDVLLKQIVDEVVYLLKSPHNMLIELWKQKLTMETKQIVVVGEQGVWSVIGYNDFGMLMVQSEDSYRTISNGDSIRYNLG
jgi:BirA family biotin operon repressor/biotin-[acetyl-CoA-carboxylase] ligase